MTLGAVLLHRSGHAHDWGSFWAEALLLQPFLPGLAPWNPPAWSLGIEMLCYALFPFVARCSGVPGLWMLAAARSSWPPRSLFVVQHYGGATSGQGAVLRGLAGFHLGMALGFLSPRLRRGLAVRASLAAAAGLAAGVALLSAAVVVIVGGRADTGVGAGAGAGRPGAGLARDGLAGARVVLDLSAARAADEPDSAGSGPRRALEPCGDVGGDPVADVGGHLPVDRAARAADSGFADAEVSDSIGLAEWRFLPIRDKLRSKGGNGWVLAPDDYTESQALGSSCPASGGREAWPETSTLRFGSAAGAPRSDAIAPDV